MKTASEVKIEIPIYNGDFYIVFSDDFSKDAKRHGFDLISGSGECSAIALRSKSRLLYMLMLNNLKVRPDLVAHEAVHIVNYIFDDHGVDISLDHDEHYAYMLDWVVEKVFKAAYDLKKKIIIKVGKKEIELKYQ